MTPERLAEIKARAEAATKGPWHFIHDDDSMCMNCFGVATDPHAEITVQEDLGSFVAACLLQTEARIAPADGKWEENTLFIAHARQDIPDLLAELARVTAERDQLQAIFERDVLTDSEMARMAYERGVRKGASLPTAITLP